MSQITQKGATGALALQSGGAFQSSTDSNLATLVGTRYDLSDGREVIFVGTGSVAISTSGLLCQDSALVANHQGLTVTTVTAYSANGNTPASVAVTLGATAVAAGAYQGGFLTVQEGAGIGQTLRISNNPVALASGTNVVITLEDSPNTALTTSSVVSLTPAHGSSVVISPTTPTNVTAGVTLYPIPANSYGFLVSKGITAVLSDSTAPGVGASIAPSATTAGAIAVGRGSFAIIGSASVAAVSAKATQVFINV
jgi:hypothetical protein